MNNLKKPLSDADYIRLANFRYALRRFMEFSEMAAAAEGLPHQQHQALLAIRGNPSPPANVGYLAERLCVRSNTAAELSQRLGLAGLITRTTNENDRRQIDLELTELGKAKLETLSQVHRAELAQLKPDLVQLMESLEGEISR